MSDVRVLKLVNGEDVVAKVEKQDNQLILSDPLRIIMIPSEQGMGMALISWIPYSADDKVSIPEDRVLCNVTPENGVKVEYQNQTSSIVQPNQGLIH